MLLICAVFSLVFITKGKNKGYFRSIHSYSPIITYAWRSIHKPDRASNFTASSTFERDLSLIPVGCPAVRRHKPWLAHLEQVLRLESRLDISQ
jgi:hypothetical protein